MKARTSRTPFLFLTLGVCWAVTSDPVITFLTKNHTFGIQDSFRGFNDFIFVLMATALLYFRIGKEHKKLKHSEAQYRALFFANPNPMWIYHIASLKFVEVNDAAIAKYGYTRKEFLEMTLLAIRPASDSQNLKEAIKALERDINNSLIWEHITKKNEHIFVSVSSHKIVFNNQRCRMVMVTDLTESTLSKKKLESAYEKEKMLNDALEHNIKLTKQAHDESRRMAQIIDKISNLVLMFSKDGKTMWANKAFVDFTGYSLDEIIGKRPGDVLFGPKTDRIAVASLQQALSDKRFFSSEIINYKKDRSEYWTQFYISPIFDEENNFEFFISVENIITSQKEKEERLQCQYRAFREIAWSNSHKIRKPLASILGLTELLKQSVTKEEREEYLLLLNHCSQELDDIIKKNVRKINDLEGGITP